MPARSGNHTTTPPHDPADTPEQALENLTAALDTREFVTTLVSGTARVSHLTITSRRYTQLSENIYAADGWFWWSWAERLAPVRNVYEAASKIAHVLGIA